NWTASALNSGVNVLRFVDMIPCRAFLVTTVYEKCHTPSEREPAKTDQGVIPGRPRVRDTLSHL
ncbi:hypothetical protein, partial [Brevibacterium sp. 2SA]|uniref:hypothetical protein n=1 Tax=Brevibacterium sp. 2SA TaxID=2502198 RepID=UPI001BB15485